MRAAILLTALTAAACGPATPPPAPVAYDGSTCETACVNVQKVRGAALLSGQDVAGCKVADKTRAGATCLQVCENAEANGVDFEVVCLTRASSCEAAYRCGREP